MAVKGGISAIEVAGTIVGLDASGIGPNSGEITVVIQPIGGSDVVEVFAGILGSANPSSNGIEQGVYASYVSMLLTAMTNGWQVNCSYVPLDKFRINGLSLLPHPPR